MTGVNWPSNMLLGFLVEHVEGKAYPTIPPQHSENLREYIFSTHSRILDLYQETLPSGKKKKKKNRSSFHFLAHTFFLVFQFSHAEARREGETPVSLAVIFCFPLPLGCLPTVKAFSL